MKLLTLLAETELPDDAMLGLLPFVNWIPLLSDVPPQPAAETPSTLLL
jgi:hypothetical protein